MYRETADFFGFNRKLQVKIYFLYSIEEYNFFCKKPFQNWICGFTGNNNMILVFPPSVIEKLTIHKKEDVSKIIAHELSHIIYGYTMKNCYNLFDEAIAVFTAKQRIFNNEEINLEKIDIFRKDLDFLYKESPKIINYLILKYGKERLFDFFKSISNEK